jgi:predicted ATPase
MKESIHIKNLGPVLDILIEDIKPFTVLIGESGSGKSTLMKALAMFRWIYKMHNIQSYLKHSKISESSFKFDIEEYIESSELEDSVTDMTEIIYTTTLPSGNEYKVIFAKNELSNLEHTLIAAEDIYFNKVSFVSETRNVIPLWAEKGAQIPKAELGYYFQEVYNQFESATDDIRELPVKFLGVNFLVEKTQFGKKYFIEPIDKSYQSIKFKNSSSGTQTSVPISLVCEYYNKYFSFVDSFNRSALLGSLKADQLTKFKAVKDLSELGKKIYIHIEEPELSLYPDAQCSLINNMIEKCMVDSERNIEIMFSTHSPYIINHLNLLIKAGDTNNLVEGASLNYDNIAVYEIEDGEIQDLKLVNKRLIDSNALSETINRTYSEYSELDKI